MIPPINEQYNNEVSSNYKDEVLSMVDVVPKLSNSVTRYALRFLRANVQFSAIALFIQLFLEKMMSVEELSFIFIYRILSSIASKTVFPCRNFM